MSLQTSNSSLDPRTWTIVIWALYLGSFVTGISGLVGLILAYLKRDELAGTAFESHAVSAIRTFWIGLVAALVGLVLTIVLIGPLVMLAVAAWFLFRSVRGLVLAIDSKPIADPQGWL
ncbi:DUF4870 family protein [Pelagibacterium limicola]|uniref:DUF4870 family protein n=1 Tax=Pelagibacterium limicola TaxID=2791022 RepID=UPI0018AF7607|nr:hypothetical protein [Pelagibacterium limicola]